MMNSILNLTGTSMGAASWDWVFCGAFLVILIAVLLYARSIPQGNSRWWALTIVTGLLAMAGMTVGEGWLRVILIDLAAFTGVALVWIQDSPKTKAAARSYLYFMIAAVVLLGIGTYLAGEGTTAPAHPVDKLAVAFLIIGFSLKLALVPFYFWLPGVTERSRVMTSVMIISVIDIAAVAELIHLRESAPWIFTGYPALWLVIALLSMFGGALLALAQTNIKRMLAFSTIDDMGYLVLGTLVGSTFGISGAILGALSHAFFKLILFGSVGVAENGLGHDLTLKDRGVASRFPVSAALFIFGALGMIGVPPLFGFIGRWRLYLSGVEFGGLPLALTMAAATGLALLYYVRAIHRVWLGKPESEVKAVKEPAVVAVLMVVLLIMLAIGLFPGWLTGLIG
jgi:multicomponent Na+:H+ antiporter subunit D